MEHSETPSQPHRQYHRLSREAIERLMTPACTAAAAISASRSGRRSQVS
jgi:hypothetical protein